MFSALVEEVRFALEGRSKALQLRGRLRMAGSPSGEADTAGDLAKDVQRGKRHPNLRNVADLMVRQSRKKASSPAQKKRTAG